MVNLNYATDEKIYEAELKIDNKKFAIFFNEQYNNLKKIHSEKNFYTKEEQQIGIIYEPGSFCQYYNVFDWPSIELYDILLKIKETLKNACAEYQIDYDEQKYMIHGWFNYVTVKNFNGPTENNLSWHDHGKRRNAFHGYYCVNAEPSITHYKINEKNIDRNNKNGRLIIAKTGIPHAVGRWEFSEPRITVAYNIMRLDDLLSTGIQNEEGPFIPLL